MWRPTVLTFRLPLGIAVVTNGALGVSKRAGIPAGDSLVKAGAVEMRNAAAALGVYPPILLGDSAKPRTQDSRIKA